MPGNQTELTARLEISKRQFFQWHFVEKCSIPEVKERMDELTQALISANYDFDFVAEYDSSPLIACCWLKADSVAGRAPGNPARAIGTNWERLPGRLRGIRRARDYLYLESLPTFPSGSSGARMLEVGGIPIQKNPLGTPGFSPCHLLD